MDSQIIGRLTQSKEHSTNIDTYGAYKRVDKKIKPISQRIPLEFKVTRTVPYNLLIMLCLDRVGTGVDSFDRKITQGSSFGGSSVKTDAGGSKVSEERRLNSTTSTKRDPRQGVVTLVYSREYRVGQS